jgi:hypothetical protein
MVSNRGYPAAQDGHRSTKAGPTDPQPDPLSVGRGWKRVDATGRITAQTVRPLMPASSALGLPTVRNQQVVSSSLTAGSTFRFNNLWDRCVRAHDSEMLSTQSTSGAVLGTHC